MGTWVARLRRLMQPDLFVSEQIAEAASSGYEPSVTRTAVAFNSTLRPLTQRAPHSQWDQLIDGLQNHY